MILLETGMKEKVGKYISTPKNTLMIQMYLHSTISSIVVVISYEKIFDNNNTLKHSFERKECNSRSHALPFDSQFPWTHMSLKKPL